MRVFIAVMLTAMYWAWESVASGNIRVDLLLIYPLLFTCYVVALWPKLRWLSIFGAAALMVVNYGYFIVSYRLFDKYPG